MTKLDKSKNTSEVWTFCRSIVFADIEMDWMDYTKWSWEKDEEEDA